MKLDDPRITTYLPVAILIAFALAQIDRAYRHDESPWNGSGFGMFSTNDHGAFRTVQVTAIADDGERRVRIPAELRRLHLRARDHPTHARLMRLALALEDQAPGASALRIEVWRALFDPDDLRPSRQKLSEVLLERGP